MSERLIEIIVIFAIVLIGIFTRKLLKLIEKGLDIERDEKTEQAIDKAVEEAIRAVEEEARAAKAEMNLKGDAKKKLAIGLATRLLENKGISIPTDLLIGKISAGVQRLFR